MTAILYGINNCDTVKKARRWLDARNVDYQFVDFRKSPLAESDLRSWCQDSDWSLLLNRRSTTWRQLADEDKTDVDEAKAVALMLMHPTLIKRPVLATSSKVVVGFKEDEYRSLF